MRGYTPPVLTPAPRVACPILDTGPVPTVDGQRCAATPPTRSHRTTNTHPTTRRAGDTRYPRWTGTGARLHPSPILTHHQHPSHLPSFRRRNVTPDPERGPGPRGTGARLPPNPRSHPTTNTLPTCTVIPAKAGTQGQRCAAKPNPILTAPPTPIPPPVVPGKPGTHGGRAPVRGYTPPPTPIPPAVPAKAGTQGQPGRGYTPNPFSPHHQHPSPHPSFRRRPGPRGTGARLPPKPVLTPPPTPIPPTVIPAKAGTKGHRGAATPQTHTHPTIPV